MMKVISVREQETLSEAVKDPRWIAAINEEMETLCKIDTWDLIPHTPHKKSIECRWIYKVKHNSDALINCLKAWLNLKEYGQTHGIDYAKTFAPVAKMTIVPTVIALETAKRWNLHQLDVKNINPFFKVYMIISTACADSKSLSTASNKHHVRDTWQSRSIFIKSDFECQNLILPYTSETSLIVWLSFCFTWMIWSSEERISPRSPMSNHLSPTDSKWMTCTTYITF